MSIYLIWNQPNILNRDHFPIFNLEISQEENHFAKARLMIDAMQVLPSVGAEGILQGEDGEIFFKGYLVGNPIKMEGDLAEIDLIARPPDFLQKMAVLQIKRRVHPFWDPLWVKPGNRDNLEEIQDGRMSSLYCDRKSGELSEADWLKGNQRLDLGKNFFFESLQTKIVGRPLTACTVKIHAYWVQKEGGVTNVGPQIRRAFPHFKVSTYTKKALTKRWPETGKRLGRSGLHILKSELKPVMPFSPLYPSYSPPLVMKDKEGIIKRWRIKRHWFKPILWIGWEVRQKRKETLSFTLHHNFHLLFPGEGKTKTLEFTLQNINPDPTAYPWYPERYYEKGEKAFYKNGVYVCQKTHQSNFSFEEDQNLWIFKNEFHTPLGDPARASFFLTKRGYQAAEHAMERAKAVLAQTARCFEVSFEASWEAIKDVTTNTSIDISDPRLPGGKITGKVVKYSLFAKGKTGERYGRVTLLYSVKGKGNEKIDREAGPLYALDGYCDEAYQIYNNKIYTTPTGLTYFSYDDQLPSDSFKGGPLLKQIELTNGPEDQETEMRKQTYTSFDLIKQAVSRRSTRIRLVFKDLRTKERLEHSITVKMAEAWSVPG